MDDDTAYMQLLLCNSQGEVSSLEIGIHALATVNDKAKKGGGVRAYAEAIGKGETSITRWVNAAEVYSGLSATLQTKVFSGLSVMCQTKELQDKPRHLYEISKADSAHWQMLVDLLIKCDWSVKETQSAVNRVKSVVLLDWMQADFKEIATVPATAKRIENATAEINASLEI